MSARLRPSAHGPWSGKGGPTTNVWSGALSVRSSVAAPQLRGKARAAFTLLEMLIAVVLLATAFTIIWSTFSTAISGWHKGQKFMEQFHHGDFVMEQLVSSLRSAAFFDNKPDKFGFWLETSDGEYPHDQISWVKSGSAFMPPNHPLNRGLHRVVVGIEDNDKGDPSFSVRAFPHLLKEVEIDDYDPWHISDRVQGLRCRVYNYEDEDWDDEWEDTNSVPRLLEVTLYLEPVERGEPAVEVTRLVEIPIAPDSTNRVVSSGSDSDPPPAAAGEGGVDRTNTGSPSGNQGGTIQLGGDEG